MCLLSRRDMGTIPAPGEELRRHLHNIQNGEVERRAGNKQVIEEKVRGAGLLYLMCVRGQCKSGVNLSWFAGGREWTAGNLGGVS